MNRFLFTIPVAAAAILATSITAFAADEKPKAPDAPEAARAKHAAGDRLKEMTEKLALTEEQQGKLKEVFAKYAPKAQEVRKDTALSQEDKRAKMTEIRKSETEEIRALLTPEQKEKMKEMRGAGKGKKAEK